MSEWCTTEHAEQYLVRGEGYPPHRAEGEAVLLDELPTTTTSVLDLGSGDGRLASLVRRRHPGARAVLLDVSPPMLDAARARFAGDPLVTVAEHDLDRPLPELGRFDAVVSAFAIHHCTHERKRALYAEVFSLLGPGGVFCNLDRVASPTVRVHQRFLTAIGARGSGDPSDRPLDVETQLRWLREIGFDDVDCHWKWRELALLAGVKM